VEGRVDVGESLLVGRQVEVVLPHADGACGRRRRGGRGPGSGRALGPCDGPASGEPRRQDERCPDRDEEGRPTTEGVHAHLFERMLKDVPGLPAILGTDGVGTQGKVNKRKISQGDRPFQPFPQGRSRSAEAVSRKTRASGWRRSTEAGQAQVTGPSSASAMAARLAGPGTIATACGTRSRS